MTVIIAPYFIVQIFTVVILKSCFVLLKFTARRTGVSNSKQELY